MNLLNVLISGDKTERYEVFYNLCSAELSTVQIKKILLNPELKEHIDSNLLLAGLLGAIKENREKYIDLIFEFTDKKTIQFNLEQINILFNYASYKDNLKLMEILDEKFSVIEKTITSSCLEHLNRNRNYHEKLIYMDFSDLIEDVPSLSINPFALALRKNNFELLNTMLNKNYKISPSLIKSAFIYCVETGNKSSSMYLINNKKTNKVLSNNGMIKEVLTNNKRDLQLKKEISIILDQKELDQTLKINDEKKPARLKL